MFKGAGKPVSDAGLQQAAYQIGVTLPALWAVMTVETKGCGFLSDRRPQILFERHVFHKRTDGRFDGVAPDLSNRAAGGYGSGGVFQYDRLDRAITLDRQAALESTSWGLGQVMGFNAAAVGFPDVESMVRAMCESEDAQFGAMVSFIAYNGLGKHLKGGDWTAFAFHYNGPDFQKNAYDEKLRRAFARYSVGPLPDLRVRAAQLALTYLGYSPGGVDGWFGPGTQRALERFQKDRRITPVGALDDASSDALVNAVWGSGGQ